MARRKHHRSIYNGWNIIITWLNSFNLSKGGLMKIITYGLGGYDESKPNNNIVEEIDLPDEETE